LEIVFEIVFKIVFEIVFEIVFLPQAKTSDIISPITAEKRIGYYILACKYNGTFKKSQNYPLFEKDQNC
jgi:hypothetical protein